MQCTKFGNEMIYSDNFTCKRIQDVFTHVFRMHPKYNTPGSIALVSTFLKWDLELKAT